MVDCFAEDVLVPGVRFPLSILHLAQQVGQPLVLLLNYLLLLLYLLALACQTLVGYDEFIYLAVVAILLLLN